MTATTTPRTATEVGTVFVRSWGYDQTDVDFYEIVTISATGKSGKAREIKSVRVGEHGSSERVIAATGDDRFVEGSDCARCGNHHRDADGQPDQTAKGWDGHDFTDLYTWQARFDRLTVTSYGDHAYRWDGTSMHQTGFGFGH